MAVEPSGDLQGGRLAEALKRIDPDIRLVGVGGDKLIEAGARLWLRTTDIAFIGPGAALLHLPLYIYHYWRARQKLLKERPDFTVLIDSPATNMRFAGVLRRFGLRSAYFFPPSAWTTSEKRLRQIFDRTDKVICTFGSNAEMYRHFGMDVAFFGHPLNDMPEREISKEQAKEILGVSGPCLSLLPGSRESEIRHLLPIFLECADRLHSENPSLTILIPCATEDRYCQAADIVGGRSYVRLFRGQSRLVMLAGEAALMSSGTASLEAAILGTPMVLGYVLGWFDAALCRFLLWTKLLRVTHIGLPSLIANRRVVPEFVQNELTADNVLPVLRPLLSDTPARQKMIADLADVRRCLGEESGVTEKIADCVYGLASKAAAEDSGHPFDVVLTSNSPGEVSAWVKHTAKALKGRGIVNMRVVTALVPCPYASGAEAEVASGLEGVDVVLTPAQTVRLVLGLKVPDFEPREHGVVAFLGGDLMHAKLLALRLKYPCAAYAVRDNILLTGFNRVAVYNPEIKQRLEERGFEQVRVIGNLSADGVVSQVIAAGGALKGGKTDCGVSAASRAASETAEGSNAEQGTGRCIGIFPGSRFLHIKVALDVFLQVAASVKSAEPDTRFVLSVSPFVSKLEFNSALKRPLRLGLPVAEGTLIDDETLEVFSSLEPEGSAGRRFSIKVRWGDPYKVMSEIDAALTIPGTNTGELGCCGIPMVVGLSADAFVPRGGLGGIIDKLPLLQGLKRWLRRRSYARHKFAALPNRIAGRAIIPEVIVQNDLAVLSEPLLELIRSEDKRRQTAAELIRAMGVSDGAGERMADTILDLVKL